MPHESREGRSKPFQNPRVEDDLRTAYFISREQGETDDEVFTAFLWELKERGLEVVNTKERGQDYRAITQRLDRNDKVIKHIGQEIDRVDAATRKLTSD